MKIDLYTKFILTLIAFSLTSIAIHNLTPKAYAAGKSIQKIIICDPIIQNRCARVVEVKRDGSETANVLFTIGYND